MELTLNITGSLEEITSVISAISKQQEREKSLFTSLSNPTKPSISSIATELNIKKKRTGRKGVPIEIHVGSIASGFVLHKIYNSMKAAAKSIGVKQEANIIDYVDKDRVYKGVYKFYRHK